ncbi:hypothetical protein DPEC_G00268020 [Dallia pectoralis]|uniref:Uncharacterized protein n=1 Tax=Dallia pectoralis TaxID=75939 RepID=A0ACC2FNU0_DALPE|nr:hypothetical protein DPEC_G00268020 [Dallia pectoralis]
MTVLHLSPARRPPADGQRREYPPTLSTGSVRVEAVGDCRVKGRQPGKVTGMPRGDNGEWTSGSDQMPINNKHTVSEGLGSATSPSHHISDEHYRPGCCPVARSEEKTAQYR